MVYMNKPYITKSVYDDMLFVYYIDGLNIFVTPEGDTIYDLYSVITPQDLFMFRSNPDRFDRFPYEGDKTVTVYITQLPLDDPSELYWIKGVDAEQISKMIGQVNCYMEKEGL